MIKEIGSEFWISETKVTSFTSKIKPDWLESWGSYILTSSGRGAISLLLKEIEPKNKTVLLPAYLCESVINPFISYGYKCLFYDINEDLEAFLETINIYGDIGVFLHMGYFGFSTNKSLEHVLEIMKERSVVIVEDITHTLFSEYKRSCYNDYYVASIRKWMGLPSGGFLASTHKEVRRDLPKDYTFSNIRKNALIQKGKYIKEYDDELKAQFLELFAEAEDLLNRDMLPFTIDEVSKSIIYNCDINNIKDRRKANFKFLLEKLKSFEYIEPVFRELPEQICPLFFPIYIKKGRQQIRQYLSDNNIYCPIHWPMPQQVEGLKNYKAMKIYDTILSIPCDQRYGIDDMSCIVKMLKKIDVT